MKRIISLLVAFLLVISVFSGCGIKSPANETKTETSAAETKKDADNTSTEKKLQGKITYATNRTDKADRELKELADEFMKANPGTEVEIEALKDPATVLKTRMAANELPDVTLALPDILPKDYSLYFASIDDLGFTKDNIYFYKYGLGDDGKLYKISSDIGFDSIAYNKKVFEDCSIEKVPETLDELYTACEKIKAKGIIPVATNFKDKWPLTWYTNFFADVNSGNSNYTNELANKDELFSNDSGLLDGLKVLKTLKDKEYVEPDLMSTNWDGFKRDMAVGKVAMTFLGTWIADQVVDNGGKVEELGVFPFPFPGKKGIRASNGWYFAVSKNSENVETAKAFLKFMYGDGKCAKKIKVTPANIGIKADNPFVNELLSYKVPVVESVGSTPEYQSIFNKAQIDYTTIAQEYLTSKNPDEVIKKYNAKWAEARKAVSK